MKNIVLKNAEFLARFDPGDGQLIHLSAKGRGPGLIRRQVCRYLDQEGRQWHTDEEMESPGGSFETVGVKADGQSVTVTRRSKHLTVVTCFEIEDDHPLLKVAVSVQGTGEAGSLLFLNTPRFDFTAGFNDAFEDERDLFSDGAEIGGDRELPCWRVFFRKGHKTGLLLATRSKKEMARFHIMEDSFAVQPHVFFNYSTIPDALRPPFQPQSRKTWTAQFEIGPWSESKHKNILRKAGLNDPAEVGHPPARGKPKNGLKGKVFCAVDLVSASQAVKSHHPGKWLIADMPWAQKGRALFASTGVQPPPIVFDPKLKGLHRVCIGIGNGNGVTLRGTGDPETRYRITSAIHGDLFSTTFGLYLSGRHKPIEVDFGVMRLDGKKLRLGRFPDLQVPCVIDYIRFEKLSPAQIRKWEREEKADPVLPISGFADIPDIASVLDMNNPDPRAFSSTIWEHANCRFQKIFWRIDGQCSDYPSKLNTMRYPSGKVHGIFYPHSKAYGRALLKTDMLELAVDAARKYGVELWGWMRFNSYMGNVMSDFYRNNPKYWEEWDSGRKDGKLCLAFKAVREHKIGILVEAAKYGLNGISLGFLRHPPVVQYAKVMRDSYKKKYGKEPPRDSEHPDGHHRFCLPDRGDDEYVRWWQFRSQYLTRFGRELKKALKENGLEHIKISIWVRPNHCLFDGIDLPLWLDEGLCDEVVSQMYVGGSPDVEIYWERPKWKKMVQSKVPLVRTIVDNASEAAPDVRRILAEGYDGICSYESNATVLNTDFIKLFRSLRK